MAYNDVQPDTGNLVIPKRKPGRPHGTKNRPKGEAGSLLDQVERVYKVIEHMLTDEQKTYYARAFKGKEPFDPMRHAEFFALLYSVYADGVLLEAIDAKLVSQDVALTLREYRMALKELDDMKRARAKEEAKEDEKGRLVDPTRKSALDRVEAILAEIN